MSESFRVMSLFLWGITVRDAADYRQPGQQATFTVLLTFDRCSTLFIFLANLTFLTFWTEVNANYVHHLRSEKLQGMNLSKGHNAIDPYASEARMSSRRCTMGKMIKMTWYWLFVFEAVLFVVTLNDFGVVRFVSRVCGFRYVIEYWHCNVCG